MVDVECIDADLNGVGHHGRVEGEQAVADVQPAGEGVGVGEAGREGDNSELDGEGGIWISSGLGLEGTKARDDDFHQVALGGIDEVELVDDDEFDVLRGYREGIGSRESV